MAKDRESRGFKKKYCKLCLEKVGFVIKGGKVFKDELTKK